jgi:AcrR family transcriptional regulator
MPTTPAAPKRPGPARSMTLAEVVDAALRIADTEGLNALSMRRLADELGVGAMTLYRYVATKDELQDQLVVTVLGDLATSPDPSLTWREQLTAVTTELHEKLRAHPGATEIILSRPLPSPAFDRYREAILAILRGAGFPVDRAVDALTSLTCYALGFSLVERVRHDTDPRQEQRRLKKLPKAEFPNLTEAAAVYPGHLRDRAFTAGLTSMLNGLEFELVAC